MRMTAQNFYARWSLLTTQKIVQTLLQNTLALLRRNLVPMVTSHKDLALVLREHHQVCLCEGSLMMFDDQMNVKMKKMCM